MNKEQFKKMLKPILKECIQEALVESSLISGIISEVVKGMNTQPRQTQITEQKKRYESDEDSKKRRNSKKKRLDQTRKSLLEAVNKNSYGGVDVFEGLTPMQESNSGDLMNALSDVAPGDAGVDISGLLDVSADKWSKLL
tara:strand:+ start:6567 stop:6986 length:420 start_codon:yes stop_codon:yes gene_type:complete